MPFSLRAKGRKSKGGSGGSDSQSWIYGLLCLGLVGFFGWVWWHSNQESQSPQEQGIENRARGHPRPSPLLAKPEEKKVPDGSGVQRVSPIAPVHLEAAQYKAVTNALHEFAQVAEKIKKPDAAPTPHLVDTSPPLVTTSPHLVSTNPVPPAPLHQDAPRFGLRPVETVLEAQIALARLGIFPGAIDGRLGTQTRLALSAYQRQHGLPTTGLLDKTTKPTLLLSSPITAPYTITSTDLGRLLPLSKTWLGKSEQARLDFENILELLSEKSFSYPKFVRDLNPGVDWDHITAGTRVILPSIEYPPVTTKAAMIRISLEKRILEAFDASTNLLIHFPCSIGHLAEKRPVGELRVEKIIHNPNYTFDPAVFPESEEAQSIGHKLILPPGPNNPVGVAWLSLNRPGYGIHGTPVPEQVGRTESHGCFRLANWNAEYLSRLVWIGMPVLVEP